MPDSEKILILGGSGFLSGTLAGRAVDAGHQVWTVTRGRRQLPSGVTPVVADRKDRAAFEEAIAGLDTTFDMVLDCIGYDPEDAMQDIEVFRERTPQLIFVSTDFVFDPAHRVFPQPEEATHYLTGDSYGAKKRLCEQAFLNADTGSMAWTVVRPCHIYGPGSLIGCLPEHGRDAGLIDTIREGGPLRLVGGGHFLQQPILARDLSDLMLSFLGNQEASGEIFCATGPDTIESREFYGIIADILGVTRAPIEEIRVSDYLTQHPGPRSSQEVCKRNQAATLFPTVMAVPSWYCFLA